MYDVLDDDNIKTSTLVNAGLTTLAIAVRVTAPFILVYGILDYSFDLSEKIDAHSPGINTGLYDK
jgi:hypothetical protein